jgi:2-polyprenyl-3-methyl-5-hydroxy-6-metoxy-1,4-benzoquinol methylase
MKVTEFTCPICAYSRGRIVFLYDSSPSGEVKFGFSKGGVYHREVIKCELCGHYISRHEMNDACLYNGDYVNSNYRDEDGIRKTYDKINGLDPSKSDNTGRVKRILEFTECYFTNKSDFKRNVLDVGSGLCLFLGKMKAAGWNCTALDPDKRAVSHAIKNVGVPAVCGDYINIKLLDAYDLITFNKVLEHVSDPIRMLAKARVHLRSGGLIYVEVPDGEYAERNGSEREEFFIDHLHIFSFVSLALMAERAGFAPIHMERLQEPSTKFTLRAFLVENSNRVGQ